MLNEWRRLKGRLLAYVSDTGMILGEVEKSVLHEYHSAWYNGKTLGRYVDVASAQKAVEAAHAVANSTTTIAAVFQGALQ